MKNRKMKIAIVAPAYGPTGGPEVVVKNLTDALLAKGVDVTLFAPADWKTKAKHIPTLPKSLWNMADFSKQSERVRMNYVYASQTKVLGFQDEFDLIHLHSQRQAYSVCANAKVPCVVSFHSAIDPNDYRQIKKTGAHCVALSPSHKKGYFFSGMIQNGIPVSKVDYSLEKGKYLITIGRICREKGIDLAIKIAKRSGKKLLILGRIGISEERRKYFEEKIKPFVDGKQIVLKSEVSNEKVYEYLKNAEAFLFPIRPKKKFLRVCPLVVMESLASGTPVIGVPIHPMPKALKDPKVACLSLNMSELIRAAKNIQIFDRSKCRKYAEQYFNNAVMADEYIKLYEKILGKRE